MYHFRCILSVIIPNIPIPFIVSNTLQAVQAQTTLSFFLYYTFPRNMYAIHIFITN